MGYVTIVTSRLLLDDLRTSQFGDRAERRLRRIQPEPEVCVAVRLVEIRRLMPLRIPAGADLCAALVLAKTDRWNQVLERLRISVGHVLTDFRGIVGRVLVVRARQRPRELLRC